MRDGTLIDSFNQATPTLLYPSLALALALALAMTLTLIRALKRITVTVSEHHPEHHRILDITAP